MKPASLLPVLLFALTGVALAQSSPNHNDQPVTFSGLTPKEVKTLLRDIKGTVKDVNGNGIEGAIVTLKDLKTGKVVSTETKKDGAYIYYDLDIRDEYEITASRAGFEGPVTKKVSEYDTRRPAIRNFELERKTEKKPG